MRNKGQMRGRPGPEPASVDRPLGAGATDDRETSSARKRIADVVPAGWLDRLLAATLDLPLFGGELAVIEAAVDAISGIAEGYAVGVCFVPDPSSGSGRQTVVRRLPLGALEMPAGIDPARLFPGMAREYVTPIPGGAAGSTLHVASNDEDLDDPASVVAHFVERAATVVGRALTHARAIAALGSQPDDRQSVDQRMLQADKLANFGQIAAGVVHELNNPLTSIVAYSDYLIRKAVVRSGSDPDDLERLKRISESATRMLHFTRDLVSYARPTTGMAGPVVLHSVIDQAVAFCEHVLSASGVRVERRYGANVLAIRGVAEQVVQVFVNLLTNASQAAPPHGGSVVLTTTLADLPDGEGGGKRALVFVEDNGSGIAPEHLPHVFVPFFTTKGDRNGTGLGLSIVRSILESHGGSIRVESELGRGARFILELPIWVRTPGA